MDVTIDLRKTEQIIERILQREAGLSPERAHELAVSVSIHLATTPRARSRITVGPKIAFAFGILLILMGTGFASEAMWHLGLGLGRVPTDWPMLTIGFCFLTWAGTVAFKD